MTVLKEKEMRIKIIRIKLEIYPKNKITIKCYENSDFSLERLTMSTEWS